MLPRNRADRAPGNPVCRHSPRSRQRPPDGHRNGPTGCARARELLFRRTSGLLPRPIDGCLTSIRLETVVQRRTERAMGQPNLDQVAAELRVCARVRPVGRVVGVEAGRVEVAGLGPHATIGDRVRLCVAGAEPSTGEVVSIDSGHVTVLGDGDLRGLGTKGRVVLLGPDLIAPDDSWVGRVIDPEGRPLDEGPLLRGLAPRQVIGTAPPPAKRRALGARIATGLAVFDTILPLVRGQRIGLFAGSGVGKSTLLAQLAQGVEAAARCAISSTGFWAREACAGRWWSRAHPTNQRWRGGVRC